MKNKIALVTGITGQDGSYLAELLLKKNIKYMEYLENLRLLIQKESIIYMLTHTIEPTFFYIMGILQTVIVFII